MAHARRYEVEVLQRNTMRTWFHNSSTRIKQTVKASIRDAVAKTQAEGRQVTGNATAGLRAQLLETQRALVAEKQGREMLAQDMKRSFMRGVCALNMEAMQVRATLPVVLSLTSGLMCRCSGEGRLSIHGPNPISMCVGSATCTRRQAPQGLRASWPFSAVAHTPCTVAIGWYATESLAAALHPSPFQRHCNRVPAHTASALLPRQSGGMTVPPVVVQVMKRGMAPGGMNPSATTVQSQYIPSDDGEPQPEAVPANLQNMLSAMNMGPAAADPVSLQPAQQSSPAMHGAPPAAPRSYAVRHG